MPKKKPFDKSHHANYRRLNVARVEEDYDGRPILRPIHPDDTVEFSPVAGEDRFITFYTSIDLWAESPPGGDSHQT